MSVEVIARREAIDVELQADERKQKCVDEKDEDLPERVT